MRAASFKSIEENSQPSSLFTYPGHQDFDSTISDTGTHFYDRNLTSRRYALVGVACSSIFSCLCIIAGVLTLAKHGILGVTRLPYLVVDMDDGSNTRRLSLQGQILTLILDLIVTLCTESVGFVHGISLRSALASESRLHFNTNLRLLTAARGWHNPNGALLNGISAILLIVSYSLPSLIVCPDVREILQVSSEDDSISESHWQEGLAIAGLPLLMLGVVLLLQVMVALSGMRAANILTWSSSPFDLTAALVHHTQLTPATFRCMRPVSDINIYEGPAKPPETQPSPWHAHPSIRKVIIFLWVIVAACVGWAALVMCIWDLFGGFDSPQLILQTWSFFHNEKSNYIIYALPYVGPEWWILLFVNIVMVQGPLTLGLHCSELITNVIRDERQWRCATGRKGLRVATNPLKSVLTDPICLILFISKPFLHWMFGLSFSTADDAVNERLGGVAVVMFTAQIWNLCIGLFVFACFFTFIALRRPCGPQPAAYGHLQTLANLVDEWSPVMWWGHKEDGILYCHAGTSDHPLPDVKMDCVYAGSGAGPSVPVS
ncbi:uncharacterized protein EDB93DRAFT_1327749 [Suillus bovinus]|uniref:uncharacterized protein n=1 Tax=Suillus bovinus TaxID=48563 RepID=UPI001B864603|nr:uncharacterized protein EDB93DRAFT_1327749 [Suillus bovinus]KAG2151192.1 hypothetical protein EDB93DRAFT_1327749 [Suillus bovinus]